MGYPADDDRLRVDTTGEVGAQVKHNIRAILSVLVDDPATLRILFAFGASVDPSVSEKIDESDTVMRLLDRNAEIETRYSGDFVEAIDGLAGRTARAAPPASGAATCTSCSG